MIETHCPDDLIARSRAGTLTAGERSALDLHLASCPDCAFSARVHGAFERSGAAQRGDDALIANAVNVVMASRSARRSRGGVRRWATLAVAASVLLAGGLASAGIWVMHLRAVRKDEAAEQARVREVRARAERQRPRPAVPAPSPEAVEPQAVTAPEPSAPLEAPPAVAPVAVERGRTARQAPAPASGRAEITALFTAANEARRGGDAVRAQRLYGDLQRKFPGTRESRLSFVSLGRLLLDGNQPAAALQQFDRYLADGSGDVLAAEALYGRARSLTALERTEDARKSWNELLSRFPDSVYADLARRQIGK